MQNLLKILYLFLALFLVQCSDYVEIDCDDIYNSNCLDYDPEYWNVEVILTILNDSAKVPIWIYSGKYGQGAELISCDTLVEPYISLIVPVNSYYSVKAEYSRNNKTIYCVDGVYLGKKYIEACDTNCWQVKAKIIDLRLKKID